MQDDALGLLADALSLCQMLCEERREKLGSKLL